VSEVVIREESAEVVSFQPIIEVTLVEVRGYHLFAQFVALRCTGKESANRQGQRSETDVTGEICTKWNERESTWRKSGSCQSRGTNQSRSKCKPSMGILKGP
jgi:hypothetical protein